MSNENATSIILEAGQSAVGKLLRYDRAPTRDGDEVDIAVMEIDGQPRSVWLLHQALRSQFARHKPVVGEVLRVANRGKKESASSGRQYWDWAVEVEREETEYTPDWSSNLANDDEDS